MFSWRAKAANGSLRVGGWLSPRLAPSTELRKWFGHDPDKWSEFCERYLKELESDQAAEDLNTLRQLLDEHERTTLVFAAKDTEHNNAVALRNFVLNERL